MTLFEMRRCAMPTRDSFLPERQSWVKQASPIHRLPDATCDRNESNRKTWYQAPSQGDGTWCAQCRVPSRSFMQAWLRLGPRYTRPGARGACQSETVHPSASLARRKRTIVGARSARRMCVASARQLHPGTRTDKGNCHTLKNPCDRRRRPDE